MRTLEIIKTEIENQNIQNLGFYSATQHSDWFNKLTTSIGIDTQASEKLSRGSIGKAAFFYLTYDIAYDYLKLNIERFSYKNSMWQFDTQLNWGLYTVKWVNSSNGEYAMVCNSNVTPTVCEAWITNLSVIYRNT